MGNKPEIAPPGKVERDPDVRPLTPGAGMSTQGPDPGTAGAPKAPAFGVTTSPRPAQEPGRPHRP